MIVLIVVILPGEADNNKDNLADCLAAFTGSSQIPPDVATELSE